MLKPVEITSWKGAAQMASRNNEHETGFADIFVRESEWYRVPHAKHYYILMVKEGSISLSCKLYGHKSISAGTMALVPRGGKFEFRAIEDTNILLFAFSTTIIRTDKEMLEYFCTHSAKRDYEFNTLPICSALDDLLNLIRRQLHERKLKHSGICHVWNTYFFHMMMACYDKDEITAFMRPIISGGADFKSFIENNYLEAAGNVTRLITLSGLSVIAFNNRFLSIYGMKPKKWLDEKLKTRILDLASEDMMTPGQIAREIEVTPQRFNDMTNRFWGVAGSELIRRVQTGEPIAEVRQKNKGKEESAPSAMDEGL